jgi:hypothetical protein
MGGNIVDSTAVPYGVAGGTLLGPEGAAREGWFLRFRVQARDAYRWHLVPVWWVSVGVWGSVGCL